MALKYRYCTVPGCPRIHSARGYCGPHYNRLYLRSTPADSPLPNYRKCRIPGCQYEVWRGARDRRCYKHLDALLPKPWEEGYDEAVQLLASAPES